MSIGGLMRTSVSGMAAQSNELSAIAGNVANVSTVGYKAADAEFSSLLLDAPSSTYLSGGVQTTMRYDISRQGVLQRSSSQFDIAISGNGFFIVEDMAGNVSLTRAGAFVPDGEGRLINAAGYKLLGFPVGGGPDDAMPVNGIGGLEPIDVIGNRLEAVVTTAGNLAANLPSSAMPIASGDMPSANAGNSLYSARSSVVVYDNLGNEKTLDIYYARSLTPGEWEVSVFDAAGRSPSGVFPYSGAPLTVSTLTFNSVGHLDPAGAASISIPVPGGAVMTLNFENTTQLASEFAVLAVQTNGNPPTDAVSTEISPDGIVYQTYENGTRRATYRIPLATVTSPDNLIPKAANIFQPSSGSGDLRVGVPGSAGLGTTISGALESSTVDLAAELTEMVEAQRNYTANSRVFQTGSELMEVLVNLKR